ncbi:MAG: immunoglobulin-like domain-containing protein [Patescibacteria group bacterium]|jgi:hypothetical protein
MRKFVVAITITSVFFPWGMSGNIARAASPTLGTFTTADMALDVAVSGNYAYIAESSAGIQIVDISNTSSPTLAGSYTASGANRIAIVGTTLYVADGTNLQLLDISTPTSPSLLGTYAEDGLRIGNVVSDGTIAYVTGIKNTSTFQIKAIDVQAPSAPSLKGTLETSGASDLALDGHTVYVTSGKTLVMIDAYPNFAVLGTYTSPDTSTNYLGVAVANNVAYLNDTITGFTGINVSNPASPTLAFNISGRFGRGLVVANSYAYVTSYFIGGLEVFDLSQTQPSHIATYYGTGEAFAVALYGTTVAVVADGSAGIRLFNVSDPKTISPVPASVTTPGATPGTIPSASPSTNSNTDPAAPTITLKGNGVIYVSAGSKYKELGYTAADASGNSLTSRVTVSGKLDTNKVGVYTRTYAVTDTAGKANTTFRYVIVFPTVVKQVVKNGRLTMKVGKKNVTLRPFPKYSGNVVAYKTVVKNTTEFQYLFLNTDATSTPELVLYNAAGKLQKRYSLKNISTKGINFSIVADPSTRYTLIAIAPKTGSLQVTQYGLAVNGLKNLGKVTAASGKGTVVFHMLKTYTNAYALVTGVKGSTAKPKVWLYFPPAGKIAQDKNYDTKKLSWTKTSVKMK